MPTSSDLVKQKRAAEAWDAYMAGLRAAAAAQSVPQPAPSPEPEPPAPLLGPDGLPIAPEPSDG